MLELVYELEISLNSPAIWPAIKFPSEAATNHMPIICPTSFFGEIGINAERLAALKASGVT